MERMSVPTVAAASADSGEGRSQSVRSVRVRRQSDSSSRHFVTRQSYPRHLRSKSLRLMSATGFTQKEEWPPWRRAWNFFRLPHFSEYFMSVDHRRIWRRHLAWSLRDGEQLRNAVTSRFASNMVFMSLLLGAEIGVLFSPSNPANTFRAALADEDRDDPNFWGGIVLCVSIGLTLSSLVANFTAWAIIGAVSPHNSHAILRSSIGFASAQLPSRLVVVSIYSFAVWVMLFVHILTPSVWSLVIPLMTLAIITYIVVLYSSFGRLVIYSRAMQHQEIFEEDEEHQMSPKRLFEELLKKANEEKGKKSPLPLYYTPTEELGDRLIRLRTQEEEQQVDMGFGSSHATQYVDKILACSGNHGHSIGSDRILRLGDSLDEENHRQSNGGLPQSTFEMKEQQFDDGNDRLSPLASRPFRSSSPRHSQLRSYSGISRGYSDTNLMKRMSVGEEEDSSKSLEFQNSSGQAGTMATLTL